MINYTRFLFGLLAMSTIALNAQIVPPSSNYNSDIVWENVYTEGNAGKVNRGLVDAEGNAALIFMPDNESRVHKIDGNTGQLIWSTTIANTVGFGISEINDNNRIDYLVSGGIGSTQERWVARLNGHDGSTMWSKTYNFDGGSADGVRMTIVGADGYIYGAGFVGGDEGGTIFVVYAGKAMIMKIDPATGDEVWTHSNSNTEYALAVVQDTNNDLYYGSTKFEGNLTLTKMDTNGTETWTQELANTVEVIPADLAIDHNDVLYFGGHTGREGAGAPFDYTCLKLDTNANVSWIKHYANPRGYSLEYIRNELYGLKVKNNKIYLFGGSGDESESYSVTNAPYLSSDVWNGWVLITDLEGNIERSDLLCHADVNTATEYGDVTEDGYMIFNDTDASGDTEVGVMRIKTNLVSNLEEFNNNELALNVYPNPSTRLINVYGNFEKANIKVMNTLGVVCIDLKDQSNYSQINIGDLPKGIYYISVQATGSGLYNLQKIVKH